MTSVAVSTQAVDKSRVGLALAEQHYELTETKQEGKQGREPNHWKERSDKFVDEECPKIIRL